MGTSKGERDGIARQSKASEASLEPCEGEQRRGKERKGCEKGHKRGEDAERGITAYLPEIYPISTANYSTLLLGGKGNRCKKNKKGKKVVEKG